MILRWMIGKVNSHGSIGIIALDDPESPDRSDDAALDGRESLLAGKHRNDR